MKDFFLRTLGNLPAIPPLPPAWQSQSISFADVGARGGPPMNWLRMGCDVAYLCFEPDPEEALKIEREFSKTQAFRGIVHQKALGAKDGIETLRLTRFRPSSSLLEPNDDLLFKMADSEFYSVEQRIPVPITTLDSALEPSKAVIDYLKIDVQGYELEVLKGSTNSLDDVVGCELEVSFLEIYKNQPFFAEVDMFMRSHGFFLADLERFWWRRKGAPIQIQERGSLAYGNAFYLKSSAFEPKDRAAALKSSIICSAMGLDELSWEIVAAANSKEFLSSGEVACFCEWVRRRRRQTRFWFNMGEKLQKLPGRQTLGRWLSLWGRALEGNSHTGSDALSWNRKTSW